MFGRQPDTARPSVQAASGYCWPDASLSFRSEFAGAGALSTPASPRVREEGCGAMPTPLFACFSAVLPISMRLLPPDCLGGDEVLQAVAAPTLCVPRSDHRQAVTVSFGNSGHTQDPNAADCAKTTRAQRWQRVAWSRNFGSQKLGQPYTAIQLQGSRCCPDCPDLVERWGILSFGSKRRRADVAARCISSRASGGLVAWPDVNPIRLVGCGVPVVSGRINRSFG